MNNQEYEQKKKKCWLQFCQEKGVNQELNISIFDAFDYIFDRAYALGKQEKEAEKISSLEEEIHTYAKMCSFTEEDYTAIKKAVEHGISLSKYDAEDTVIQGWVAIDEAYNQCFFHTEKPIQKALPIADTGDYDTVWYSDGKTYLLDTGLFPDMDSDSDPIKCEIIIKRKKK